jgi:hypothetical protein
MVRDIRNFVFNLGNRLEKSEPQMIYLPAVLDANSSPARATPTTAACP